MRSSLFALLFALFAIRQLSACDELRGRWDSEARSRGVGQILDFQGNGIVFTIVSTMVEGTYSVDDDLLVLRFPDPGNPEKLVANRLRMTFDEGTLHLQDIDHEFQQTLTRAGKADPNLPPFVGTWVSPPGKDPLAAPVTTRLTSDGRMIFRNPVRTVKGTYQCVGDHVTIRVGDAPEEERTWHLEGAVLIFDASDRSGEKRFRRSE